MRPSKIVGNYLKNKLDIKKFHDFKYIILMNTEVELYVSIITLIFPDSMANPELMPSLLFRSQNGRQRQKFLQLLKTLFTFIDFIHNIGNGRESFPPLPHNKGGLERLRAGVYSQQKRRIKIVIYGTLPIKRLKISTRTKYFKIGLTLLCNYPVLFI